MSVADDDASILAAVSRTAAPPKLKDVEAVHIGRRFILASATHMGTSQKVLLTITRRNDTRAMAQLTNIANCLGSVPNVGLATVIDKVWPPDRTWGCLVTSWHYGATLQETLLARAGLSRPNLMLLLRTLASQLDQIHQAGFAHGDISASNVIVDSSGVPHLIDFEYVSQGSIVFDEDAFETNGYSHPERMPRMASKDFDLAELQRWDRYAFGKLILGILSDASAYFFDELTLYNQRALRLIGCLLLDGRNAVAEETALGLDFRFFADNALSSFGDVVAVFDRVIGVSTPDTFVPELKWIPESVVEIGTPSPAAFTDRVRDLVATPEMQQLAACQQLGLINYIWPSATHTRLEHAIGTYGLACSAVSNLFADPQSPIFRVLITPRQIRALLAAALLHDIGHYPLAHDLEEAYPGAFDHEARSIGMVLDSGGQVFKILEADEDERPPGRRGWQVSAVDVASVINGSPLPGSAMSPWVCGLLHSVLSGTLDVDKLDYLIRDSRTLGVRAGEGIDTRRILSSLTVVLVPVESKKRSPTGVLSQALRLGVRAKGVRPAELVGRVRSHMFGVVYWHHTYRSIKAMIHWILWDAARNTSPGDRINASTGGRLARRLYDSLRSADLLSELSTPMETRSMPRREGAVLALLAEHASASAREMLLVLADKGWYKSILTLEHPDNLAAGDDNFAKQVATVWEASLGLPEKPHEWVAARLMIAERIQSRILSWFNQRTEGEVATTIRDWESHKVRFQSAAAKYQLFLLDLVERRKASEKDAKRLYFSANERSDARSSNSTVPIPVRTSYDQVMLEREFMASNGAIRLVCHPDHSDFVARSIPFEDLLAIVMEELAAVS